MAAVAAIETIDSDHPLFLHPSDTTGLSLISIQLIGSENYSVWSRGMRIALLAKNKIGFVNETCKKENLPPGMHHQWDRCNAFVFAWIMNAVSKDLLSTIIYSSDAHSVWIELKERFDKINGSRIYQLHREISITQQGLDSITTYFSKLKLLWDEFVAICGAPTCNCDRAKERVEHDSNIKLFQFLMGLNENYGNVRSNLLMRVPLPTLNEAYSVLIQEESQRGFTNSSALMSSAMSSSDTSSVFSGYIGPRNNANAGNPRRNWICQHCNKKGHTVNF